MEAILRILMVALVLLPVLVSAQTGRIPELAPVRFSTNSTPVRSVSRMFRASGASGPEHQNVVVVAEKIREAVESLMGAPTPSLGGMPIFIQLRPGRERADRVVRQQRVENQALIQEILVDYDRTADEEQVVAAITWALLNRYALVLQSPSVRLNRPAEVPEWLACGVAQGAFAVSRQRNRAWLRANLQRGALASPEEILSWERLPVPSIEIRVACALWVDVLESRVPGGISRWVRARGRGRGVTPAEVLRELGWDEEHRREMQWDLVQHNQASRRTVPRPFSAADYEVIDRLTTLESSVLLLFVPSAELDGLTLPEVLRRSEEPWAEQLLIRLQFELLKVGLLRTGPLEGWLRSAVNLLAEVRDVDRALRSDRSAEWAGAWLRLERERVAAMQSWIRQQRYLDRVEEESLSP